MSVEFLFKYHQVRKMAELAKVYNLHALIADVPQQSIPIHSAKEGMKINISSNTLAEEIPQDEHTAVSNSMQTDYNENIRKKAMVVIRPHMRKNTLLSEEAGGETKMSDQMDRKQVEDLMTKELTNHAEKSQLKLEALTSEMNTSIQSVENNLTRKFESMNSTLASTLQELKYSNELLKKDVDQHVLNTAASNRENLSEIKQLIANERNEERRERKTDRRYMITTIIATFAGAATFVKLFL